MKRGFFPVFLSLFSLLLLLFLTLLLPCREVPAEQPVQEELPPAEEAAEEAPEEEVLPEPEKEAEPLPEPEPEPEPYVSPIDFETLWAQNEDIIGWITISDTEIDYPVLQDPEDDSFYLHHDIDGNYSYTGSIYMELANRKDFTDFNTVLYGHNMLYGTMFTQLHKFEDQGFFDKHRTFTLYLPDRELTYTIFAVRRITNDHLLYLYDIQNPEDCSRYIEDCLTQNLAAYPVDKEFSLGTEDRLLTLSTCTGNSDYRFIVVACLTEDSADPAIAERLH